jgi:hypothetical protein
MHTVFSPVIAFGLWSIGSDDYLKSLSTLLASSILPVLIGNIIVAIIYFYIQKKEIK